MKKNNNVKFGRMVSLSIRSILQIIQQLALNLFGIELGRLKSRDFSYEEKARRIEECLGEEQVDLWKLRELALTKGGFLEAKYRKRAWLKLVGVDETTIHSLESVKDADATTSSEPTHPVFEEEKKTECADGDLIRRDVGRSVLFKYSCGKPSQDGQSPLPTVPAYASDRLATVLENTIRRGGSSLHYYQGLHDVAGVLLHNMEYQSGATVSILSRLCQSHFRDAMRENFGNVTWLLSVLLLPLVEMVEPNVHYALQTAEVELSNLCLPWIITWFTHDMYDAETAGRLADMFLSSHPMMPFYFAVAVITHPLLKQAILTADLDDPAFLFSMVKKMPLSISLDHAVDSTENEKQDEHFSSLPRVPAQELLEDAMSIMKRIPPRELLHLVDGGELYSSDDLLARASSISMFKAVPSWSVAGGELTEALADTEMATILSSAPSSDRVHGKLASGIPVLMDTVAAAAVLKNRNWGSQRYLVAKKKKGKSSLFRKLRRRMFARRRVS